MMKLQDPKQTKMLIVTLPETTPVLEAARLRGMLAGPDRALGLDDASLAATGARHPLLAAVRRPI